MQTHPVQHSKVKCAEAVALMHDGKYKAAARRFTEVRPALGVACLGSGRAGVGRSWCCSAGSRCGRLKRALPPWAQMLLQDLSEIGLTLLPMC